MQITKQFLGETTNQFHALFVNDGWETQNHLHDFHFSYRLTTSAMPQPPLNGADQLRQTIMIRMLELAGGFLVTQTVSSEDGWL